MAERQVSRDGMPRPSLSITVTFVMIQNAVDVAYHAHACFERFPS
jgi:hypothetical protein